MLNSNLFLSESGHRRGCRNCGVRAGSACERATRVPSRRNKASRV